VVLMDIIFHNVCVFKVNYVFCAFVFPIYKLMVVFRDVTCDLKAKWMVEQRRNFLKLITTNMTKNFHSNSPLSNILKGV